jgi:hypothetical protein
VSATYFAFNYEQIYGNFQNVESSFWKAQHGNNVLLIGPSLNAATALLKKPNACEIHQQIKHIQLWIK